MAQLFFKYGAMNSGKSIELLKIAHNYEEQGKKVMVLTSALDNRSGVGVVSSRIGISQPATPVSQEDSILRIVNATLSTTTYVDGRAIWPECILVDEAQFLTAQQVADLATIVDSQDVPVICFGLKTDFQGKLFEGSKALFEMADKLEETKTVCQWCDHKATMNLRTVDGAPTYDGDQIQIGDQEYISVCRYHYTNPLIRATKNKKEKEV
ncbi:thymidine kinase [Limosilactobacillus fermentum]|uniref:thymidine kinase n=1 Tax=Limosilactobacillus fermentum TaxID=1613 RepID=UPI001E4BD5C1|nr:thymidine kinase [Limosilactobacillus fermentum]MCD5422960.1 thymidine kinase [Limosilactobacillus fermentum]